MYIREVVARSCSVKKVFWEMSQNSQERTCARVSFFNKVAGLRLWHRCFPVNFAKFLRTSFLTEHLRWLLPIKDVLKKSLLSFGTQFWDALRNVLTTSCLKAWICQNVPKNFLHTCWKTAAVYGKNCLKDDSRCLYILVD